MAKDKAPELESVRMFNGQQTSAGYSSPGDVVAVPPGEALALVDAGYATRVAS